MGMLTLGIILVAGIVAGLIILPKYEPVPRYINRRQVQQDKLDDVDQMALWGIVNNDSFYQ